MHDCHWCMECTLRYFTYNLAVGAGHARDKLFAGRFDRLRIGTRSYKLQPFLEYFT